MSGRKRNVLLQDNFVLLRYALCAVRSATESLTSRRPCGIRLTSFYATTARKLAVCLFSEGAMHLWLKHLVARYSTVRG
jgi:hypothetical protein